MASFSKRRMSCWLLMESGSLAGESLGCRPRLDFLQPVTGAGIEVKIVKPLQFLYAFERGCAEWRLAVKGMEHNALQEIAEGHVVVFGKALQNLEKTFLDAYAGLDAFDEQL